MSTLSLAVVLAESARRVPDKVAVIDGDVRLTYAQLWHRALQFGQHIRDIGCTTGNHVALLCPNTADFATAYYGILAAGGVVVPIPTLLNNDEIEYLLTDSEATTLVYHESLRAVAEEAATRTGVRILPATAPDTGAALRSYVSRSPEDAAVLFYTSGTTGRPKGAMLTHLNLVMCATVNAFDANPFRKDDIVLGCLPLFHTFGQTVAMNSTFRIGATLVLQANFDAGTAIELMNREQVTCFFGVPTMFLRLVTAAQHENTLPNLHMCISGGAALPVAALEAFQEAFTTTILEGYGLSETSPTAAVNQPAFGTRAGTVGHAVWGVEVEIADADIEDHIELLPPGARGEVVVRGHNVFTGYHRKPDATAEVLVDGWFRTGDIGITDDEGFLTIVDRKKDLIIRNGYNVYPREVEEVLMRHPAIGQVAVIGLPSADVGEEVCAVVVLAPGHVIDADELTAWSRERLGRHKYPRRVEQVTVLPIGPSHKVLKRELRQQFAPTIAH